MESLTRLCPCGAEAANARGVPRCNECRLAVGRDYQREYKRNEQRRADVLSGRTPGAVTTANCTWCNEPFEYVSLGRKRTKCDDCRRKSGQALASEWQKRNPERHRELKQRHLRTDAGKATTSAYNVEVGRYAKYGVTREWFEATLAAQGGKCGNGGCPNTEPGGRHGVWHIDHDRACCPASRSCGQCVRGILCENCNKGLGFFADEPSRLMGAADYLRAYKSRREADADLRHPALEE